MGSFVAIVRKWGENVKYSGCCVALPVNRVFNFDAWEKYNFGCSRAYNVFNCACALKTTKYEPKQATATPSRFSIWRSFIKMNI